MTLHNNRLIEDGITCYNLFNIEDQIKLETIKWRVVVNAWDYRLTVKENNELLLMTLPFLKDMLCFTPSCHTNRKALVGCSFCAMQKIDRKCIDPDSKYNLWLESAKRGDSENGLKYAREIYFELRSNCENS